MLIFGPDYGDERPEHPATALKGHTDSVISTALTSRWKFVATGSLDGTVNVWDTQVCALVSTLEGPGEVFYLLFNFLSFFLSFFFCVMINVFISIFYHFSIYYYYLKGLEWVVWHPRGRSEERAMTCFMWNSNPNSVMAVFSHTGVGYLRSVLNCTFFFINFTFSIR